MAVLQVGRACASLPQCFFYRLEDRPTSLQALGAMPGVRATVSGLGYDSFADFAFEARKAIEAANALAAFCLTPPGDTPKRKGFYDAIMFGCCLLAHFKLSVPMSRFACRLGQLCRRRSCFLPACMWACAQVLAATEKPAPLAGAYLSFL